MASFLPAASAPQQPPAPEDEDPSLDESDLYSLAHSYLGPLGHFHGPSSSPETRTPPWTSHLPFPFLSSSLPLFLSSFSLSSLYLLTLSFLLFFFLRVSLCHPGWSAVVRSQLTAASNSWAHGILLLQSPKYLELQVCTTCSGEMGAHCVAQADLELPGSSSSPALASQSAEITGSLIPGVLSYSAWDLTHIRGSHIPHFTGEATGSPCSLHPRSLESLALPISPLTPALVTGGRGRKGRSKREAAANTNRPSPGGHERKLVTKLQNSERKKRGARR
ncbi:LOW QUALITY PROTEIN: Nuclear protein 1 [Plecturocebus cupreus]